MEAGAGVLAALQERVRGSERRIEASHDSLVALRGQAASQEVKIAVISADLEDIHDDLAEIKGQLKWALRGIWTGVATLTGSAILAIATGSHP